MSPGRPKPILKPGPFSVSLISDLRPEIVSDDISQARKARLDPVATAAEATLVGGHWQPDSTRHSIGKQVIQGDIKQ